MTEERRNQIESMTRKEVEVLFNEAWDKYTDLDNAYYFDDDSDVTKEQVEEARIECAEIQEIYQEKEKAYRTSLRTKPEHPVFRNIRPSWYL